MKMRHCVCVSENRSLSWIKAQAVGDRGMHQGTLLLV